MVAQRVAVFIDYQNVYMSARRAFGFRDGGSHVEGQVHPLRVGLRAKELAANRELAEVVVFRGMPSQSHNPGGYTAAQRQVDAWRQKQQVRVITRPLNYRDRLNPREKGIDVALAIEMVTMAVEGRLDVAVLFSGDTDLLPAAEFVRHRLGDEAIEFAAWKPADGTPAKLLSIPGARSRYHVFDEKWYGDYLRDGTDYTHRTRRR